MQCENRETTGMIIKHKAHNTAKPSQANTNFAINNYQSFGISNTERTIASTHTQPTAKAQPTRQMIWK